MPRLCRRGECSRLPPALITLDRKAGGHLLDLEIEDASAKVDSISGFEMDLPENKQFYQADLSDSQRKSWRG